MSAWRNPGARHLGVLLAACLLLLAASVVLAQSGGVYDLSWSTVDGGGGTLSTGGLSCAGQAQGVYTLGATAGQPDAGLLAGGSYVLGGGFWGGSAAAMREVFLPLVLLNH